MAKRTGSRSPAPLEIRLDEPEPGTLRAVAGSKSDRFNSTLIDSMLKTSWFPPGLSDEDRARLIFTAVTGLRAFAPADEIEAMLSAQAMAAHATAMECSRRAMIPDQPYEAGQGFRKAAANASRVYIELLAALDRRRGKGGQQVVRVEHVHVHPGGKAVVGNIATGGGGGAQEILEEPRGAPARLAHNAAIGAVLPALRGNDTSRDAVSVACDEEPPALPPARWARHGTEDSRRSGADSGRPDDARDAHGRDGGDAQVGAGTAVQR